MEKLENIIAFVRIAEAGSIRGGAERLGLTISAASKALRRLESRVGVPLVRRNSHGLSLTDDGEALLIHGRRILAELEAVEGMLAQSGEKPRGRVRISLPVAFGRMYVLPLLVEYQRQHADVVVDLKLEDRFSDLVGDGVDLALRMTRDQPRDSNLVARRLTSSRLVLCASPSYLDKHGVPQSPEDLAEHVCLAFSHSGLSYRYRLSKNEVPFDYGVAPRLAIDNGEALRDAAIAGLGLCQLHAYIAAPEIESGRLRPVLLDYLAPPIGIYAVYQSRDPMSLKVRSLIDHLALQVKEPAPWHKCLGV
ncbi:LysR family transcriptional regulator [Bradyrhizobium sp.]|uniref:LysR family transcriptional regulator n=1 Tax=Bradyrhizobium sp. TaxID=376 RepID=UPI001ECD80FA|nr:LysR family transcriptional regulator [Bradyrhizobium sp.]MBV8918054.1 LysR family transcriptional regulator [Bradyrhizobium sp.]MBV9983698.1 LysR family transcriptional regulator [Bradyrhizobium sp.]